MGVLFSKRMDIIAASQVYRVAGTGYSQLDSLSLMEKLLSRLAPPQQSGTTLANAGLKREERLGFNMGKTKKKTRKKENVA